DQVIPQIADGAGWKTTITLINLSDRTATFSLSFWDQGGRPLVLPLTGVATAATVTGTLLVRGSRTIQTDGTAQLLSQGWAELTADQSVGGLAVFRQRVPGRRAAWRFSPAVEQFALLV